METGPPLRPAEYAERALVGRILSGEYPVGGLLPGERLLARTLGVTRPTVRETLQRLSRDGWLDIRQGVGTRVRDYTREGGLRVLATLARGEAARDPELVARLLEVRRSLAPDYVRAAVEREPAGVLGLLAESEELEERPESFAGFDWRLHRDLARLSGNPLYAMILNDFSAVYSIAAPAYFADPGAREGSRRFYGELRAAAAAGDPELAREVTEEAVRRSVVIWSEGRAEAESREVP